MIIGFLASAKLLTIYYMLLLKRFITDSQLACRLDYLAVYRAFDLKRGHFPLERLHSARSMVWRVVVTQSKKDFAESYAWCLP